MTKAELVDRIYMKHELNVTKRAISEIVDEVFFEVKETIKKEKRFAYPGFGTFTVRTRKARRGVNPQTGQPIKIPQSKVVGFRAAPLLKKEL